MVAPPLKRKEEAMKTVFSKTQDVCDVWAKQEQAEARTGSNTSFRGDTLYSYGTPIARIVEGAKGERIAFISSNQWSSGTSKVQGEAYHSATQEDYLIWRVPALGTDVADHEKNLRHLHERVVGCLSRLERGRVSSAQGYRDGAKRALRAAYAYADIFGIEWTYTGRDPESVRHRGEPA